ncbi:MAG TPA: hypothetical protein VFV19_15380 [Candidatus Polarisedimenticolaceae bacterium]|nr:hypothetical protein [Candidatus Polarisedimenticolaceae bacterium]
MTRLDVDLSGIGVRVTGLSDLLGAALAHRWGRFVTALQGEPVFSVTVEAEPPSARVHPFAPKTMRSEIADGGASFAIDQGTAVVSRSGAITICLVATTTELQAAGLVNLLMAAIAWRLPEMDAVLLHAAGIVLDGRAFVLVGGEGTGKSTWASLAREAGAEVLGDDLVLVHRREALACPFRAEASTLRVPGRWPLAAVLAASHAKAASLAEEPAIKTQARLAANAPFAVDGWGSGGALDRLLDRLVHDVPHRTLAFARDASFVPLLIRSAGGR